MRTAFLSLTALSLTPFALLASPGDVEPAFAPVVNAVVRATSVQADGRIVIGGDFTSVSSITRNHLARLLSDGSLDTSFAPDVDGTVLSIAVQSDNKIIIGGWFTSVGGTMRHNLARLLPTGALDTGFDPDTNDQVQGIFLQPDGRLLIHGRFTSVGGTAQNCVARLNANGTLDPSFAAAPDYWVTTVALQTDGKVIVGGLFNTVGGVPRNGLARLLNTGALDTTFNPAPDDLVRCIAMQSDGSIVVGGWFTAIDGVARHGIARLNSAGTLDAGFDPNADASVESVITQVDGKLVVGGSFGSIAGVTRHHLARLNANGTLDAGFNPNADAPVSGVTLQGDGKVIAVGGFSTVGSASLLFIARLENGPGVQTLTAPSAARLQWFRSGAVPEVQRVSFEATADAGLTWTSLGSGVRMAGGWELGGLVLLSNGQVRVRAELPAGQGNGASSALESQMLLTTTAAEISLGVPTMDVNEEAGIVSIPVLRTGPPTGTVSVNVSTSDGTALAPGDYTSLAAQTLTFTSGETTKTVSISIRKDSISERNESFNVIIGNPSSGAVLGTQTITTVRILESDTSAPGVTITTPVSNAMIAENPTDTITVSGSATDNKGVEKVQLSINGSPFNDVPFTPPGSGGTYSFTSTAITGANVIQARAIDGRGNVSSVVSRSFTYVRKRSLVVNVSPDASAGSVSGALTGVVYQAGKTYSLTASARAGFVFDHWDVPTMSGVATELPALSFAFNDTLAASALPTITAHFVPTPFVPAAIGTYVGLIKAEDGAVPSNSTQGFINVVVTGTGSFSGTVKIDGVSASVKGVLDNAGVARFGTLRSPTLSLSRPAKPPLILAFTVDLLGGTGSLTGSLTAYDHSTVTAVSVIAAGRAFFDGLTPGKSVPDRYISANKGYYTVALPAKAQSNGFTTKDFPQGDGVGYIRITKAGLVTVTLSLADGSSGTVSTALVSADSFPVFSSLYSGLVGSLSGWLRLDDTLADTDVTGIDLDWFRPWINSQHYPQGWVQGIKIDLIGARYMVPSGMRVLPGMSSASPTAILGFTDGLLTHSISKTISVSKIIGLTKPSLATNVPISDTSFTLTLTPETGHYQGYFSHIDGTKPTYLGYILQKGKNARGFGRFWTTAPKAITGTGEAGRVTLTTP